MGIHLRRCICKGTEEMRVFSSCGWFVCEVLFFFRAIYALDYFYVWSVLVCEVLWWPIVCSPMGRTGAGTAQLPKPELPPHSNIICFFTTFYGHLPPLWALHQCIQDKKKYNGVIPDIAPHNEIAHCNRTLRYMSRWTYLSLCLS